MNRSKRKTFSHRLKANFMIIFLFLQQFCREFDNIVTISFSVSLFLSFFLFFLRSCEILWGICIFVLDFFPHFHFHAWRIANDNIGIHQIDIRTILFERLPFILNSFELDEFRRYERVRLTEPQKNPVVEEKERTREGKRRKSQ